MIDKTVPHIGVLMVCQRPAVYAASLPPGYIFTRFSAGMERVWAELQVAAGHTETKEQAEKIFAEEFLPRRDLLEERCWFVQTKEGAAVATASLWEGAHWGKTLPRLHWVCTVPAQRRKGLAKAVSAKALTMAAAMGSPVYLTSQTQSWPAIGLYLSLGFVPYMGQQPENWKTQHGSFAEENQRAWQIIFNKLACDKNQRNPIHREETHET